MLVLLYKENRNFSSLEVTRNDKERKILRKGGIRKCTHMSEVIFLENTLFHILLKW